MKRTGTLRVKMSVSRLDTGVDNKRMARAGAGDPFASATNFLANRGLDNGDFIWVTGTDGNIGTVPVLFIAEAGPAVPGTPFAMTATASISGTGKASKRVKKTGGGKRSTSKGSSKKSKGKKSDK